MSEKKERKKKKTTSIILLDLEQQKKKKKKKKKNNNNKKKNNTKIGEHTFIKSTRNRYKSRDRALGSFLNKCTARAMVLLNTEKDRNGLWGTVYVWLFYYYFQRKSQSVLEAYSISGNRPSQHSNCFDFLLHQ